MSLHELRSTASDVQRHYAHEHDRPLGGYVGAMGAYGGVVGAIGVAARVLRKRPPPRVSPWDVTLITLATNKVARLLAKDPVTSPLRAPFTRYERTQAPAELQEEVRGQGAQKAVGELVTCPFCLGLWVVTAFTGGLVLAPQVTRLVAAAGTALFGADVLQYGYAALQQAVE